ncbi:MAG: HAD family phosphatase [Oscillospiraceae bacterium]|nr:HAD family phosphatase [Oscillospiraceae bacterium]
MRYSYIFDFDGVLAKTMEAHFSCYRQALAEAGVPIDRDRFYSQAGMVALEQIRFFCERAGVRADYAAIYARKRELFRDRLMEAVPIGCNIGILKALKAAGHKAAIATGSSRGSVEPVLGMFGLEVDALVTAEDVTRGKPNPDLFLVAAYRMDADPKACVVIEDSDAGIAAAKAAGMKSMRFADNE